MNLIQSLNNFDQRMTAYSTYHYTEMSILPTRLDEVTIRVIFEQQMIYSNCFLAAEECIAWLNNENSVQEAIDNMWYS